MSASVRQQIERFSAGAEDLAKSMEAAGVGTHATRGHAVLLRQMANSMRADAAVGKTPHEFNVPYYASANGTGQRLSASAQHTLRSAGLDLADGDTITLTDLNASLDASGTSPGDRILVKQALAGRITA